MNEIWRDILNLEGYYQVSNMGKVKSIKRTVVYKDGRNFNYPEVILKQRKDTNGYLQVGFNINGCKENHRVHRLVAGVFLAKNESKTAVNHIDGNKENNTFENLEWVTYQENTRKGYETGLFEKTRDIARERWNGNKLQCKPVEIRIKEDGKSLKFESARQASRYIGQSENYFTQLLRIGGENKFYEVKRIV